jgi:valyl-tRNA synthetase
MSKSLGNSPDPIDVIKEFGADALRFTITRLAPLGNDIYYSNGNCEIGRNFANKIWNASRFILQNCTDSAVREPAGVGLDDFDKWALSRFNKTIKKVRNEIEKFYFNDAAVSLYDFIWSEYCDWYIEVSKVAIYKGEQSEKESKISILLYILEGSLKLLHPIMPFITEKIHMSLPQHKVSLVIEQYPEYNNSLVYEEEEELVSSVQNIISTIRNIRGENKIQPNVMVEAVLRVQDKKLEDFAVKHMGVISKLAKVGNLEFASGHDKGEDEVLGVGKGFEIYISLKGVIDIVKERDKFEAELARIVALIGATKKKLGNPDFIGRAPEIVINKEKEKILFLEGERDKIMRNLGMK